ncbi:acetamidase/formamidase family protein [Acidihalobacter prosperus]|uniref:Acetamidase n=1 Tax=Acidihalobacter prosperus TaxID=160660 RepID=A0A1A6C8Y0_9GAMM|nr:acetamidase/formamidase family protein [Acidihalobacter prosperus]OBS11004.1 acetamidase [Acidihalobacter prosperus]
MSQYQTIHSHHSHYGWDNGIEAVRQVAPGEILEFEVRDASGGQLSARSDASAVGTLDFDKVNPVTGPIEVDGAEPGDAIRIELLDFAGVGWGWTAIIPGFGLLADEFKTPFLHISEYDEQRVRFVDGIELETAPFPGTVGLAPAAPGHHSVVPPRRVGGNLDLRDLTRGATLYLPVEVAGGLLSVGDTHAAQGDGEVCGTAVETQFSVSARIGLVKGANLPAPQCETTRPLRRSRRDDKGFYVTTGVGPDLMQASRDAIRAMIDHLGKHYGLAPEMAYALCSVAVDLRIGEVVDVPNWVVAAQLPKGIFL